MTLEEEIAQKERELAVLKAKDPRASWSDIARGWAALEPKEFRDPKVRERAYAYVSRKALAGEPYDVRELMAYAMGTDRTITITNAEAYANGAWHYLSCPVHVCNAFDCTCGAPKGETVIKSDIPDSETP